MEEPDTLGIFQKIPFIRFLGTIPVLCDVFNMIKSLNLILQKGGGSKKFALSKFPCF